MHFITRRFLSYPWVPFQQVVLAPHWPLPRPQRDWHFRWEQRCPPFCLKMENKVGLY